jgi:3-hydroxybutyryl-CoA dehydrogenase
MSAVFERIGVVGGGIMGTGIAEVCARSGAHVLIADVDQRRAAAAREGVERSLERAVRNGKLAAEARDATMAQVSSTANLDDFADRQLAIEAIVEDEAEKVRVFSILDKVVEEEHAILASNTSSIPIMKLSMATERRTQVLGLHFFNPVPVLNLVELVPSLLTSPETVDRTTRFAVAQLNKKVIHCQDRAGFIVNALLIPYLLSAIRMLESGFSTLEDIDTGMVEGCAHPMGPLALTDLIGLDTTMAVAESLYQEFKEPLFAAPPLLSRMVDAGLLGRKAGQGFYTY